jgi:hypothetical protein
MGDDSTADEAVEGRHGRPKIGVRQSRTAQAGGFMSRTLLLAYMSTKAKLVFVLAFVVMIYFLVGGDSEPVEVSVESDEA